MKALSLVFLLLTAISAGAAPSSNQLIGTWHCEEGNLSVTVTRRADGSFAGSITEGGKIVWKYEGKWSLVGDTLNCEYTKSSLEQIRVGTTDQDRVIKVTHEYYIIQTRRGARRKYSRVQ